MPKDADPILFGADELQAAPEPIVTKAVEIYNAVAKRVNEAAKAQIWCEARALTAKRRKRLKAAIPDYGGVRGFQQCLEDAAKNAFLLGKEGRTGSHRTWRPDLDFFLQEKTVTRLLEGAYPPDATDSKRIHMPTVWVPPHVRDAKPFVPASREERLAGMIVSYRRIENWAHANKLEEELAALEKRPPVLVPAPDARNPDVLPIKPISTQHNGVSHGKPAETPVKSRQGPIYDVADEYDSIPESDQFEDA